MVQHIVMWRFKETVQESEKAALKQAMGEHLLALKGRVPGLLDAQFIYTPLASATHEMALLTRHESAAALQAYADHPEHVQVAETYIRPYTTARAALDFEL